MSYGMGEQSVNTKTAGTNTNRNAAHVCRDALEITRYPPEKTRPGHAKMARTQKPCPSLHNAQGIAQPQGQGERGPTK